MKNNNPYDILLERYYSLDKQPSKEVPEWTRYKTPKTIKDLFDIVQGNQQDLSKKIGWITNLMIGIIIVMSLALIGRFYDGIIRNYGLVTEIRYKVESLELENQQLKNDIKNIHDDMELLVEKKYSEILRAQIATPKNGSSQ